MYGPIFIFQDDHLPPENEGDSFEVKWLELTSSYLPEPYGCQPQNNATPKMDGLFHGKPY